MKKMLKNIVVAFTTVSLLGAFASCTNDDYEYLYGGGTAPAPNGGSNGGNGGSSTNTAYDNTINFTIAPQKDGTEKEINATSNDDIVLLFKYDRSAVGAKELCKVSNITIDVFKNDAKINTINSIEFALDEYGAGFDSAPTSDGKITDENYMKEYKTKMPLGDMVKKGDKVLLKIKGGSVVAVDSGASKTLEDISVALISKAVADSYYLELASSSEEFKPLKSADTNASVNEPSEVTLLENLALGWSGTDTVCANKDIAVGGTIYFTITTTGKQELQFIKKDWDGGLGKDVIKILNAENADVTYYSGPENCAEDEKDRPSVSLDSSTATYHFVVTDAFVSLKDVATVVGSANLDKMWYVAAN